MWEILPAPSVDTACGCAAQLVDVLITSDLRAWATTLSGKLNNVNMNMTGSICNNVDEN